MLFRSGGFITQLKSGYVLTLDPNRPNFPAGFFVEDYTHKKVNDESVLDEHNGRFCITPEFPNGVYAYFATFNLLSDDSGVGGPFVGFKRPAFPFFIGNTYKSIPNNFNFATTSNQDEINLNKTKWSRNSHPYNFNNKNTLYSYLTIPNSLNQKIGRAHV